MKPKTLQKKLVLHKNTVADLNSGQLNLIKGGIEITGTCVAIPASDLCETLRFSNCDLCTTSPAQGPCGIIGEEEPTTHPATYTCTSCPIPC